MDDGRMPCSKCGTMTREQWETPVGSDEWWCGLCLKDRIAELEAEVKRLRAEKAEVEDALNRVMCGDGQISPTMRAALEPREGREKPNTEGSRSSTTKED